MINKKIINIGYYQYLYEFLKNGIDFNDIGCTNHYVILRKFEIYNDIVYDKDIFFIEQSLYNELINNNYNDKIVYPLYKNSNLFFSNIYDYFSSYNLDLKDIAYPIYDENLKSNDNIDHLANILCDKIRIYNPITNKNLKYIIYIDNFINDIHFHYFCNLNTNFQKKYCGEIVENNNRYIEYLELEIPNIKNLFNENNKYYIHEDINIINSLNTSLLNYLNINSTDSTDKLYISNIIKPFFVEKRKIIPEGEESIQEEVNQNNEEKIQEDSNQPKEIIIDLSYKKPIVPLKKYDYYYVKTFINDSYFNYGNNYINTSLNITLYPYDDIINNIYILNEELSICSTFINYEYYFKLSSKLGFDNGTIALINEFLFPGKKPKNKSGVNQLKEEYKDITKNQNENIEEIYTNLINDIDESSKEITNYYNAFYIYDNLVDVDEIDEDELNDDINVPGIRSTGYVIQIATDLDFEEMVFESIINTDNNNDNFIYDFSFSLDGIVDSWDQLNEILIIRSKFIDKRLNICITSNNVVLTKEWFKYLINDTATNSIQFQKQNNLIENNFMDINHGFNFIDNINCVIKEENSNNIVSVNNVTTNKIVYKPIFYKVQDLQNITLRQGVVQNIGINLGDYMNKIDTFILNINNQNIKESSRNDVFVIFTINANNIDEMSGYYNILDGNYDYISSGNYVKI